MRPLRTLLVASSAIGALVVLLFAGQDLWHYWQAVSAGPAYWPWASSRQGIWMLTCGVAEAVAVVGFVLLTIKLLSGSPIWERRGRPAGSLAAR